MRAFCVVGLLALLTASAAAVGDWKTGRATFYGSDAWSIHTGSCGYGQLSEDVGTGWDIAALADAAEDYRGSCGKCKEVRCKSMNFKDGYGEYLERVGSCYNDYASVVVMITDTCPCSYPTNAYSNKRWCCGDMYHLDVSMWAFEKLADTKMGVIAIEQRDVPCSHRPAYPAIKPWGEPTPMPDNYRPRPGWNRWMDKRIAMVGDGYTKRLTRADLPPAPPSPPSAAPAPAPAPSSGGGFNFFGGLFGR